MRPLQAGLLASIAITCVFAAVAIWVLWSNREDSPPPVSVAPPEPDEAVLPSSSWAQVLVGFALIGLLVALSVMLTGLPIPPVLTGGSGG